VIHGRSALAKAIALLLISFNVDDYLLPLPLGHKFWKEITFTSIIWGAGL